MQRRSFVRDEAGKRSFWEVTWDGPEVEIATGKVATQGRITEAYFANASERDRFIAEKIAAARKRGFVETETPLPDAPEPEEVEFSIELERLAHLRRTAFVPHTEEGDGATTASKFGGRPWLSANEPWPSLDGEPMQLMLQLDLAQLPAPGLEPRRGLLQIFYAYTLSAEYDDWAPWTPTKLVRIVEPVGEESREPCPLARRWPAKRVVDFTLHRELPSMEDLEESLTALEPDRREAFVEYLFDAEAPLTGDKIGGWPHWIQSRQLVRCPETPTRCEFVLQIDTEDHLPVMFGDSGIAFVWRCPKHPEHMTMSWQCC